MKVRLCDQYATDLRPVAQNYVDFSEKRDMVAYWKALK